MIVYLYFWNSGILEFLHLDKANKTRVKTKLFCLKSKQLLKLQKYSTYIKIFIIII